MKNKLTLSVDKTTKETMNYINEGIGEILEDALQPNYDAQKKQSKELDALKTMVLEKITELTKIILENQTRNYKLLEEINEKLDYMNQPFFKRIIKKNPKDTNSQHDSNKENN